LTVKISQSSRTDVNGQNVHASKTRADSLAFALKLQTKLYALSFKAEKKSETKKLLSGAAKRLNGEVEKVLIGIFGGGKISETAGGFNPDFFLEEPEEIKAVGVKEDEEGSLIGPQQIALAGGSGIKLQRRGRQELITGFTQEPKGDVTTQKGEFAVTRFVNSLRKNAKDSKAIYKLLSGKGKAAGAVRASMTAKANVINIPVVLEIDGQMVTQNRQLRFSWSDLGKCVRKGTFKFTVKDNPNQDFIRFNGYFTQSVINQGLNAVDKLQQKALTSGELGKMILEIVGALSVGITQEAANEIQEFARGFGIDNIFEYEAFNSAKIIGGKMRKQKKAKRKGGGSAFLSGADISVLARKRLGKIMPKGPRRGPPLSPDVLTERTGAFRRSVRAIPNYRKSMVSFFYNPLYGVHVGTDRDPNVFVGDTIREIMLGIFKRQFRVVRGF
tara:strand:+ start:543 stop:1871 length:1329 start_codon:yes stop_codon:yes gene_type:complete